MTGTDTDTKMILTVTLNPLLEKRLTFNSIRPGRVNRSLSENFTAGGKGINVSRQLNLFNQKNIALTFIGGANGKKFRKVLEEENIQATFVNTKSEMRWGALIIENNPRRITSYFSPNNTISSSEASEFADRLKKMIPNCSTVVFSGSSPCEQTDELFSYGIKLANELNKISILDTYGNPLKIALEKNTPMVLHNNINELQDSLNLNLQSEKDKIDFLKELYSRGVKLAFITEGANPFYAAKFDFHYKITPPEVQELDATGSGDAFVAAIARGLETGLTFNDFTKKATAVGAANAGSFKTSSVTNAEFRPLIERVRIISVGKKMKLIDDKPTI